MGHNINLPESFGKKHLILVAILLFTSSLAYPQWETVYFPSNSGLPWLHNVSFYDFNRGMATGVDDSLKAIIVRTTDNGTNWDTVFVSQGTGEFGPICYADTNTAIAVATISGNGIIAKTTDNGDSWDTIVVANQVQDISFPSPNTGYITATNGVIYKTTDAGNNWSQLSTGSGNTLENINFINDTIGFTHSSTEVITTTNGGNTWNIYTPGQDIHDLFFVSDSIGYFFRTNWSDSLFVYKSIDAGNSWNMISAIESFWIAYTSIYFPNDTVGYISGQFNMLKTINGGSSWNKQTSSPPSWGEFMDDVNDVYFLNKDTGFAVGGWGQYYRTTTGGECWTPVTDFSYSDSLLTVSFSDSTQYADSLLWDFGDGDTSTASNPVHDYDSAGTYAVCLITWNNLCGSDTLCEQITVTCPFPIAKFGYIDSSLTVYFSDSSTGASSWSWDFGDGNSSLLQNPVHTYESKGSYNVSLDAGNLCGNGAVSKSLTVNPTGVNDNFISYNLKVYPNPTGGSLTIVLNIPEARDINIEIMDITGRVLYGKNLKPLSGTYQKQLDLSRYSKGIYLLRISTENQNKYSKIVLH